MRVRAAGVNPVDTYIRTGTYARKPPLPYTPGTDGAGEVEAVGADVERLQARRSRLHRGDDNTGRRRRHLRGAGALRAVAAASSARPRRRSAGRGARRAVRAPPTARCSSARSARPGETVLVHGATGGVGIAAVRARARARHAVIGTAAPTRASQAVREHGADVVVNTATPATSTRS